MTTQIKINYKEYPEFMFAIISAYLPEEDARIVSKLAGRVIFRTENNKGYTFKNGLLHSYNDLPAIDKTEYKVWYKDGLVHRDDDKPAVMECGWFDWCINGKRHREGDKPAVIGGNYKGWYIHGELQKETVNGIPIINQ
jgi:hypothetical protein